MIPYDQIRTHYEELTPIIINNSATRLSLWVSPYSSLVDWTRIFSPIEWDAWQVIRGDGRCPLYPQYPVGKYFVDFGNPYLKIALECDGHEYHLDKEKDNKRDYELKQLGWTVYRIPGSDCRRPVKDEYYDVSYLPEEDQRDVLKEYYLTTIEGLVSALAIIVFGYPNYIQNDWVNEFEYADKCLNMRVSKPVKNWINTNNTK